MVLETITVSSYETNCYLYGVSRGSTGFIIDPGDEAAKILKYVRDLELKISLIVLTHGHIDHVGALREVQTATGAGVAMHSADAGLMQDRMLATLLGMNLTKLPKPDIFLTEGQKIGGEGVELTVIHTPGHTRGSICLLGDGLVFTGDTLFREGIGRTDLPGGNYIDIIKSIQSRLLTLPPSYRVYPGHGPPSTIEDELANNPFLV